MTAATTSDTEQRGRPMIATRVSGAIIPAAEKGNKDQSTVLQRHVMCDIDLTGLSEPWADDIRASKRTSRNFVSFFDTSRWQEDRQSISLDPISLSVPVHGPKQSKDPVLRLYGT